jgi:hypothetical protein
MISDRDIYAAANLMLKRYGEDAAIEAAKRADELMAAGDMDGRRKWLRIMKAIEELQRAKPVDGEAVH